ncbi:MAG: hypothetical protein QMD46_10415 [Methanomicrobiales archaeon]|nr:hypothetical protein [Methanomicrobiales archaeon]MDI6877082.1 hypothetical protein [Methanomicrobiales archaeon]
MNRFYRESAENVRRLISELLARLVEERCDDLEEVIALVAESHDAMKRAEDRLQGLCWDAETSG